MARLYREAPLNGVWEGSGNVICLDVLRSLRRDPGCLEAWRDEVRSAAGADQRLDAALRRVEVILGDSSGVEPQARVVVGAMATLLQASLLVRFAPAAVADAFCASRLDDALPAAGRAFGTLAPGLDTRGVVARAAIG